jgi:peptide/nickel transport system substrate-binding protein
VGVTSAAKRLAIPLLLALGLAHPAAAKDDLTIGLTQFPSTFNPLIDAMLAKSYILGMTRRAVTTYDKDWKLVCLLCTELPTIENGLAVPEDLPDGKKGIAITIKLHPKASWGDGTPVTADDVIFTWEVGKHPKSGVGSTEGFKRILKIDVKDPKTVVLHVDRITFDYNSMNGLDLLPAHLERAKFADPVEYRHRTTFDSDTTNRGLYFGPYRISEVVSGSHVTLVPNETWYGQKPYFKRIVVRVIENTAALEANLRSGGIDYIAGELGVSLDQALALEKRQKDKFDFIYKAGLVYEHVDLNLDNPLLQDQRVRQALLYGLDRAAISKQLFEGKQPVANSSVSPLDWVAAKDIPTYGHDPKKAAALLDAAGWSVMRGGFRHNAKGERLSFEIMTTAGNRSRELVEQVLQSQWRALGIDVRIRNEPARVFFGQTMTQRKFPAMGMYAWISSPENVPRTTLYSKEIPTADNNWSGQNYPGFRNAEMDALIDKIEVELGREKRRAMWRRIQEIYATELPVLPLYFRADPFIIPKWLKGVEPTGHQYPSSLWVENWRAVQ